MTLIVTTQHTVGVGETVTFNNEVSGFLLHQPSATGSSPVLTIAGSVISTSTHPYITAGIDHVQGGTFLNSWVNITATGSLKVSAVGPNPTFGMWSLGNIANLANAGLFQVSAVSETFGILTADESFEFINTGTFRVTSSADRAVGVWSQNRGNFVNSGTMEIAGSTAAQGFYVGGGGSFINEGILRVTSAGEASVGIRVAHLSSVVVPITNSGTIEADIAILDASNEYSPPQKSTQVVNNSGTIKGIVDLARGDDVLENSGSIVGEVYLGYGVDVYRGEAGRITGAVHGGFGDDTLIGGEQADVLYGEDGDDVVTGGGGNDVLQGGRGDNSIDGGSGVDTLIYTSLTISVDLDLAEGTARAAGTDTISGIENVWGSRWADRLRGDGAANLLYGAGGDDTLDGRAGADQLIGGVGADTLTGGIGADTFVFGRGDGADIITDFAGEDTITVHGYAAAQQIRQVGADTLVVLSATDSILLRNTSASSIGASQIVFRADARSAFEAPYQKPADISETLAEVHETIRIHAGERLEMTGVSGGFTVYVLWDDVAPGLINEGHIRVTGGNSLGVNGVALGAAVPAPTPFFNNLESGILEVASSFSGARASGVTIDIFGAQVFNAGLIDVRGSGLSHGVLGLALYAKVVNEGTIRVEGAQGAYGLNMGQIGFLENYGAIEVTGRGGDVFGVRAISQFTMVNDGDIVVDRTDGDGYGVYIRADGYRFSNGGLIDADIAIDAGAYFSNARSYITNTGEIRGRIQLSGSISFVNDGVTTGLITLGLGDGDFDGSAGRQVGQVRGDGGRDRLVGGDFADDFDGGAESDTLTGGGGNDRLDGGAGDDFAVFRGPRSAYSWVVDGSQVAITGPDGVDTLIGIELLQFDDELVSLTGFGLREKGFGGDDTIHGTDLNDVLDGGDIPPLMVANGLNENGNDRLYGYGGDDVLTGGGGYDYLNGGSGNDILNGGDMNDTLIGGDGNDRLIGERYDDILDGGAGMDTAVYLGAASAYSISVSGSSIRVTGPGGPSHRNGEIDISTDTLTGIEFLEFADQTIRIGGGGNDTLTLAGSVHRADGLSGNDTLFGGSGADTLNGGADNDVIVGGAGNDAINGGDGYDVAAYFGVRRAYAATAGSVSGNGDGADTLTGIEDLSFTDGRLTFARDGQAAQVMRLYDAAFNRSPDQSGFEIQLDTLENGSETLLSLAEEFVNSVEFQSQYGGLTNRQFVELLYNFCLNRNGDEPGVQTWVNALNGGQTRAQVLLTFSESSEHKDLLQGQLDQGLWVADEQTLQIARLYDATYDRLPDQAGLKTWRDALGGGMSLEAIAQAFTTAPEFQARYGALSNQGFVELMYQLCLNRNGDATGIQTWVDALNGGTHTRGQVLLAFSESSEHIALTRPTWLGGIPTTDLPVTAPVADHDSKDGGPQVLPSHADHGADDGAQVVAGVDTGEATHGKHAAEDGPQVLPIVADTGADDDAQVVPGADTGEAPQAKHVAEEGHDDALVLPGVIDDGFLLDTKGGDDFDAQILPGAGRAEHAELTDAGTDGDSLFDLDQLPGSDNLDDGGFHGSHHGGHDLDPNEIRHIDPWAA